MSTVAAPPAPAPIDRQALECAARALPREHRLVLQMVCSDRMNAGEVALVLDITPQRVEEIAREIDQRLGLGDGA